jgi:hypothetical protein
MALLVTDTAQVTCPGDIDEPFGQGNVAAFKGGIDVHAALGIIGDEVFFGARGTKASFQVVDFAHGIVAALQGGPQWIIGHDVLSIFCGKKI